MSHDDNFKVRLLDVAAEEAGQRLDNFLLRHASGVPKTRVYRAIRKGEVRVNKGRSKPEYRVQTGDSVRMPPLKVSESAPAGRPSDAWERRIRASIVLDNADLLVINKPTGLAVHGGSGVRLGLIESLRSLFPEARYLELVHRLDRDTSGLVLVAKNSRTIRDLHKQLRKDYVDKRYLALVAGKWPAYQKAVSAPLAKRHTPSGERIVKVATEGKQAKTEMQVMERFPGATLIEAKPISGRTHQIRVHVSYYEHAILGDTKYQHDNSRDHWRQRGINGLCLHSRSIGFKAATGHQVTVVAPIPNPMHRFLVNAGCDPYIY